MRNIARKIGEIIITIVLALAAAYLVLQVGRAWGRSEAMDKAFHHAVRQTKLDIKWAVLHEKQPFWFGDIRINPITKTLEVKHGNINRN